MKIGILDSGIGGLTVAGEVFRQLPGHDILYWGDTARMPYGGRHPDTIREFVAQGVRVLKASGVDLLAVASHTLSAIALPFIATTLNVPIFSIIDAGLDAAGGVSRKERFGVLAMRTTIESGIYEEKIQRICPNATIYTTAVPLLIPLVEEGWLNRPETNRIIKNYLRPLKNRQIDTLILGSTHLSLLKKTIDRKVGTQVVVVDAVKPLVEKLQCFIENTPKAASAQGGSLRVLVTEKTAHLEKAARLFFRGNVVLETVTFTV